MADGAIPYAPVPPNVPPDLTTPTIGYRLRAVLVLTCLFLFAFLYVGLVGGSAYFCYSSFASTSSQEELAGGNLLYEASQASERLGCVYNKALQQRKENKIDDGQFLQILEHDVLSPWRAQQQRLAQVRSLPRAEQQVVDQCGKFFRLQEESWELLAKAIRQNDVR